MENTAIAWEVLGDSTALKPLGILTIKTLRRSLQPCRMLRKTVVHVCFKACKERSPLYRHSRATTRQALLQVLQRKRQSFSSQHIKQALARQGTFLPPAPLPVLLRSPFQTSSIIYTVPLFQKTHFQTFSRQNW